MKKKINLFSILLFTAIKRVKNRIFRDNYLQW